MVFAVGKCPIGSLVGGLVAASALFSGACTGEPLTLGTKVFEHPDVSPSAAASGSPAWQPPVAAPMAGAPAAAAHIPGAAGAGTETHAVSTAGSGGVSGSSAGTSAMRSEAGGGGSAAVSSRPRRRGEAGGGAGRSAPAPAGTGGRGGSSGGKASAGTAAAGCVENLGCQLMALESTGDVHQDCVDRINQFRVQCACLPPLERWHEGEACADQMAEYDSGGSEAHAGFGDKICDGGSAQNECPGWRSESQVVGVCLQKMWDEGPPPMSDCTGSCFQTYGHFLNMTNQRMTKVACGFYTTGDGQVWSVQNFSK